jgi:hypothetical protein
MTLRPEDAAQVLGHNLDEKSPSGHTFRDVHTYPDVAGNKWFPEQPRPVNSLQGVLTDKALTAMNALPAAFGRTIGSELAAATKEGSSGANKIAELVRSFFGSAVGSIINERRLVGALVAGTRAASRVLLTLPATRTLVREQSYLPGLFLAMAKSLPAGIVNAPYAAALFIAGIGVP